jgi:uncharacterized small protein (DUF1192 family)
MATGFMPSKVSFRGAFTMSIEWAAAPVCAAASWFLAVWRGSAVTDTKVAALKEELQKTESNGLRLVDEIRDATRAWHNSTLEFKVAMAEQTAFNGICTKTLEGISNKLEFHNLTLLNHDKELALAKERIAILQKEVEHLKGGAA